MTLAFTVTTPICVAAGPEGRSAENPAVPLSMALWDDEGGVGIAGGKSGAGVRVTPKKALGYSAIWRAVNLISRKIAAMPLKVFRTAGAGKQIDTAHPAYRLLRRKPNEWMTAIVFKQTLMGHALLRGNGYAYIERDRDARPTGLLPLATDLVWPVRANGTVWYVTQIPNADGTPGELRKLPYTDVLHIRGLSSDGLIGYDVVTILRETIGKAIGTRDYSARFFKNDAKPSLALEFPAGMKDATINAITERWGRMHQGIDNAHRIGVLREGIKLNSYSLNARDSQLLENITFDAVDIANVFGLPPRKLGLDQGGGYNSIFEENQSIHDDTLDPWLATWEEEADDKLLTEEEKAADSHNCLFVRNSLMRSNPSQRSDFYSKMFGIGALNQNEIRAFEDMNPVPDGHGEKYYVPLNLAAVGDKPADLVPDDPAPPPTPADDSRALRVALRKALAETAGRMARRLATNAERAEKRGLSGWLAGEIDAHAGPIAEAFGPLVEAVRAIRPAAADAATVAGQMIALARAGLSAGGATVAAWAAGFEAHVSAGIPTTLLPEN